MITYLEGCLAELLPGRLTIDVSGLGYEVLVPLSTSDTMPSIGEKIQILTHFHVREQEQTLYGFATNEERDLFRLLITRVSGIGPKLGLAVLSGMSVDQFKNAVIHGDTPSLSKPIIGPVSQPRFNAENIRHIPAKEAPLIASSL